MNAFWTFAKMMLKARLMLVMALVFAVLSAGGLGAGLLSLAPMLQVILGEDGGSLRSLAEAHNLAGAFPTLPVGLVEALPNDPMDGVILLLIGVGILTVFGATANFGHQFCSQTVSISTVARIRLDAFRHSLEIPLSDVFRFGPSEIVSRINKDAQALQQGFNTLLGKTVAQLTKGLAAFAVAVYIDWRLTLVAVVLGPLIGIVLRKFGKRIKRGARGSLDAQASLLRISNEALQGLRAIKAGTAERESFKRFSVENRVVLKQDLRIRTARAISSPLVEALAVCTALVLVGVASKQILNGNLQFDQFILALAALGVAGGSLRPLANLVNDIQAASAPADRLSEILDCDRERHLVSNPVRLQRHAESLTFEDVVVRYDGAKNNAVNGVTLTISHGETVAFVGPNGCGKTTLLSTVSGLLRPQGGRVLIDGVDLAGVDVRSLRRQIGVVTQEPLIVRDTILANILLGMRLHDEAAARVAAGLALADDFIQELSAGYQTEVGEFGSTLSGGQRQRLAIARAIMRNPSLLILDEATSAIDAESEDRINDAVLEFGRGRTVLVIAHRLATILAADRIVVMDEGRIIDDGTHEELLKRCALYERLARPVSIS